MNIAFPALFVFLLSLPGIILRYSYREWGWKFPVYRLSIGEELAKSASFAAILNALWCFFAHCFGYRVVFSDVLILLTGGFGLKPDTLSKRLDAITAHPYAVIASSRLDSVSGLSPKPPVKRIKTSLKTTR